jgi:hypothetical protein
MMDTTPSFFIYIPDSCRQLMFLSSEENKNLVEVYEEVGIRWKVGLNLCFGGLLEYASKLEPKIPTN